MLVLVLGLRLVLEVVLLAVLGWWAWDRLGGVLGVLAAVGLVGVAATVWGLVVSPRARLRLPAGVRVTVEVALFALGALALAGLGLPGWGIALVVADVVVVAALAWTAPAGTGLAPHDVQRRLLHDRLR